MPTSIGAGVLGSLFKTNHYEKLDSKNDLPKEKSSSFRKNLDASQLVDSEEGLIPMDKRGYSCPNWRTPDPPRPAPCYGE